MRLITGPVQAHAFAERKHHCRGGQGRHWDGARPEGPEKNNTVKFMRKTREYTVENLSASCSLPGIEAKELKLKNRTLRNHNRCRSVQGIDLNDAPEKHPLSCAARHRVARQRGSRDSARPEGLRADFSIMSSHHYTVEIQPTVAPGSGL